MKMLSWNVRGMSSAVKKRYVGNLVKERKPDFLLLQETKIGHLEDFQLNKLWYDADFKVAVSEAEGSSGGLISIWSVDILKEEEIIVNKHFILIKGTLTNSFPCIIVNIYAPNNYMDRRSLWNELVVMKERSDVPWCIGGDFNEIRSISERLGCTRLDRGMRDFQNFLSEMEVRDIPLIGRRFTWSNFQETNIQSRLDRFVFSQEWLDHFKLSQWGLQRLISDHCPVLITDEVKDWGKKPFRFINAWLTHPKCLQIIKEGWEADSSLGWAGFRILQKLSGIKIKLKEWNSSEFGNLNTKSEELKLKLQQYDLIAESRSLSEVEKAERNKCRQDFWAVDKMKESLWRQKSRFRWIKLGDRNTKFFQISANNRYRRNFIGSIELEGVIYEEPEQIKQMAVKYFEARFKNQIWRRPELGGNFHRKIQDNCKIELELPFNPEEIVQAIKECNSFKAPGPDGFNFAFVKKAWGIIKADVLEFFRDFHQNGKLTKGVNATFVVLIPKVEGPSNFNDFRPISMVGWLYKLLSKVLANRFRKVLPKFVGETQAAFLGGRQILDGVLIANEVIDEWKQSGNQGLILKLDFEKAYDCVCWPFLFKMLKNMGCGHKWISWIKTCVTSATLSVLINGSATSQFKMERGLRQGDPISPLLFNVVAEGLNIIFERARAEEVISGISFGNNSPAISHLQFADDTIIFCKCELAEVVAIKGLLGIFEQLSGLKINFSKSQLCGIGVPEESVQSFANVLECGIVSLPFKYLGLPLGANPRRIVTWKPVIERYEKKLALWKRKYITFGGRLTLVKSTLGSLPQFYMSLFKMPKTVVKKLEQIQRKFLWGDSTEKRKLHLVKWERVTLSKKCGGLGIKKIHVQNLSLLSKWWWRFGSEKESLWAKTIRAKYGIDDSSWLPVQPSSLTRFSQIWGDIASLIGEGSEIAGIIRDGFFIKVASGQTTAFWSDTWLGDTNLEKTFPRLYSLSIQKQAKVWELYDFSSLSWNLQFRRSLFQWELDQLTILKQLLDDVTIHNQGVDQFSWRWDHSSGAFTVKSCYEKWEQTTNALNPIGPKCMLIWKNVCPHKVEIFTWQALQEKIATGSELIKRNILQQGVDLVGLCPLCQSEVETAVHLLVHCPITWKVWSLIMKWWGLMWVCPSNLYMLMCWWSSFFFKNVEKTCWDISFYAVLWTIWLERNHIIFRNKALDEAEIIDNCKTLVAVWTKACYDLKAYTVEDFKRCLPGIRKLKLSKLREF